MDRNTGGRTQRKTHYPYVKHVYIGMRWPNAASIHYYQGDNHHDRGFEAESWPVRKLWATDWTAKRSQKGCLWTTSANCHGNWNSNLPDSYRDDLAYDGDRKEFAVGSADGRAIRYGRSYFAEWLTNHGKTATGHVLLDGQATRRPSTAKEWGYCQSKMDADKACFFANGTKRVGAYPVNHGVYHFNYP